MSNYDGQNPYYGGEGGGFVQNGSPFGSQGSPGGGKKPRAQTIRPVTVKQVLDAVQTHGDADFLIDGQEVGVILMIGSVHNESRSATNVSYEIGDGTGHIDVRLWLDSADDEAGKLEGVKMDHYVSIMGTIKTFGGKRHVSATHIRPITDHNEVYNHLLKSLYVSLVLRNPSGLAGAINGAGTHDDYSAGNVQNGNGNGNGLESAFAALPPLQRKIMEIVAAEDGDDGMHVSTVSRQVTGFKTEDVMDAIEGLMSEGMLYSTIDDLHVKAMG
ncbi:hypothetical protein BCR39DRAFT_528659 [Naematelia encephala]|uniref:Replication protein A C-terminal domain-containing protein n=1 Tax=Naematelia encephala TaxID=71784 RepID=A0A1Y2B7U3_9TREE|nr:hypothetical protein BCR39DRAFT_528659 [Naematelia encephala]